MANAGLDGMLHTKLWIIGLGGSCVGKGQEASANAKERTKDEESDTDVR